MENSFVTLDLKKYNEMYEKAKKIDELKERFGDEIEDSIIKICKSIDAMFNSICEDESSENNNQNDYEIGDVILIKGVISAIDNSKLPYCIKTKTDTTLWIKKDDISKKEEE